MRFSYAVILICVSQRDRAGNVFVVATPKRPLLDSARERPRTAFRGSSRRGKGGGTLGKLDARVGYIVFLSSAWKFFPFLPSTGQENNIAQPKKISHFASHVSFHRFSSFNCCLSVVL